MYEPEGVEEIRPLSQQDESPYDLSETEAAYTGPAQFCHCIVASRLVVLWDSRVWEQVGLWFLCLLLGSFPSDGCIVQF